MLEFPVWLTDNKGDITWFPHHTEMGRQDILRTIKSPDRFACLAVPLQPFLFFCVLSDPCKSPSTLIIYFKVWLLYVIISFRTTELLQQHIDFE